MNEESQKKNEVQNSNETFENRYLRSRSGPSLNSQKPTSYPSGFKPKAGAELPATLSKPQASTSAGRATTLSKPEASTSAGREATLPGPQAPTSASVKLNPSRPEMVAPMPQAQSVSRPSGVTPLTPKKHLASPASDPAAAPASTSPKHKVSSFTRPAGTPKPNGSTFANPDPNDPRQQTLQAATVATATPNLSSPHLSREKVGFNANQKLERRNMEVTRRDIEIMQFALEMKFISREDVFEKYFSVQRNKEAARSNRAALERLAILEKAGYLKRRQAFSESTIFYLATEKAYIAVNQRYVDEKIPKAIKTIDQRIFLHDKLVLRSRIDFEKQNPGCLWISDRKLRSGMAAMFNIPSAHIPDAIYELPSGERVAFELENAPKGKSAYREKINFFVKLMEMKKNEPGMFSRVAFRCVRDDVYKKLKDETAIHGKLFTVDLWKPAFLRDDYKIGEAVGESEGDEAANVSEPGEA